MTHLFFNLIKIILFPIFAISGIKYSDWSELFDSHTDRIMSITTGTLVGFSEAVKTQNIEQSSTMGALILATSLIIGKTALASATAFFVTHVLKKRFDKTEKNVN